MLNDVLNTKTEENHWTTTTAVMVEEFEENCEGHLR